MRGALSKATKRLWVGIKSKPFCQDARPKSSDNEWVNDRTAMGGASPTVPQEVCPATVLLGLDDRTGGPSIGPQTPVLWEKPAVKSVQKISNDDEEPRHYLGA